MALSDDAKQRLVIALASQSAGEEVAELVESGGGGGGGAGALEILSSPPGAPEEGQQWVESSPAQDATFLLGGPSVVNGVEWIDPGAVTVAQMEQLFTNLGSLVYSFAPGSPGQGGASILALDRIEYQDGVSTNQDMINLINNFTQGIMGKNMVQLAVGALPGDVFSSPAEGQFISDFQGPSNTLKLYKDGITWFIYFQK